ncbi:MAG: helix-turn-helix transcriptional regulator [Elusimicrobiota bacterium]
MAGGELPFADLVRERMRRHGIGLRELCRAVDLDPSFFSKVLANKRNPPAEEDVLRRIAGELDIDAPRLVVAAGRIPKEWRQLWTDGTLFESVHGMATGRKPSTPGPRVQGDAGRTSLPAVAEARPEAREAPVRRAPFARRDLEEELL